MHTKDQMTIITSSSSRLTVTGNRRRHPVHTLLPALPLRAFHSFLDHVYHTDIAERAMR